MSVNVTCEKAHLFVLGHPRLDLVDGRQVDIRSRRGVILLALLALSERGQRSRVWLQQVLWGSRPQKQAQSSLRREVANLRKILLAEGLDILESEQRVIRLDTSCLKIDLYELGGSRPSNKVFLEGIDLPGEDEFEDWLREMRNQIEDMAETAEPSRSRATVGAVPQSARNSILVLPASITSDSPIGPRIAQDVTQDLFNLLPRLRWLPVVIPGSQVGSPINTRDDVRLAEEMSARYILRLEIVDHDGKAAIHFTMVETPGQIIRWSETRSLGSEPSSHNLRSEVARAVNCVAETFDLSEQRQTSASDPSLQDPMQLAWKIRFHINQFTREDFATAQDLIDGALTRQPAHSELLMLRANLALWQAWIRKSRPESWFGLTPLIRAAMRADPLDARGPLFAGILESWQRRGDAAIQYLQRSTELDPSSAQAISHLGAAHYLSGEPERAIGPLEHALFLGPLDPKRFHANGQLAVVLWMLGRYDEALAKVAEIRATHPGYILAPIVEAACFSDMGRTVDADRAKMKIGASGISRYREAIDWMPFVDRTWNVRLHAAIDADGAIVRLPASS